MHKFKLKTGIGNVYTIEKFKFEEITKQKPPYYTYNEKNEKVQYAVCPACDNPIQICGLYKKLKNTNRPFGKHYCGSIYGLAEYNEQAYDNCPYSNKNRHTPTATDKKTKLTDFEKNIYNIMKEQFDRVIYILSNCLEIKISNASAKSMLKTYIDGEGWMYPWSTLYNIPWVFGHLTWSKNLYGQAILYGSDLHSALQTKCNDVKFEHCIFDKKYDKLLSTPNSYLDISYCLINHQRKIIDDDLKETMEFVVTQNTNKSDEKIVFIKTIPIDEMYFLNLINLSPQKSKRNQKLFDIAVELMPPLSL